MKKLVAISILFTLLTAAAFAQFKVGVTAEFQGDILRTNGYLDTLKDTNDTGYVNFLSTYDFWNDSELKFALSYTDSSDKDDPKYGALLELNGSGIWTADFLDGTGGTGYNLAGITFMAPIGDWEVWGKAGILKGFIGNTANRGATADGRFAHYNDYMDKFKFENLGIMKLAAAIPTTKNSYPFAGNDVDVSNLRWGDNAYVSVEANLKPITIAVAGQLKGAVDDTKNAGHTSTGAGFRVSGDLPDIMGLKFDVIYKVFGNNGGGGDGNIEDISKWQNRFGLFANLGLMDNTLGLTIGYSGDFTLAGSEKENKTLPATGTYTVDYTHPYYSGIDLRVQYTGVSNLTVSFNNNLSFSGIEGSEDKSAAEENYTYVTGLIGTQLGKDVSEGYFGMYNALLADYKLSDELVVGFQIGNRWYSYSSTTKIQGSSDVKVTGDIDVLQIVAAASYTLADHVTLGTGLAFNVFHSTTNTGLPNAKDIKNGMLTFGIPLTVKVVF